MQQAKETIFILSLFIKEHFSNLVNINKNITLNVKKACHCNKVFLRKTKLILALNSFVKKTYYYTYFAFRRSGIHPPFLINNT